MLSLTFSIIDLLFCILLRSLTYFFTRICLPILIAVHPVLHSSQYHKHGNRKIPSLIRQDLAELSITPFAHLLYR